MERPRPSFDRVVRLSKGARERGSKVLERERRVYELLQRNGERRDVEHTDEVDSVLLQVADVIIESVLTREHPAIEKKPPLNLRVLSEEQATILDVSGSFASEGESLVVRRESSDYGDARLLMSALHEKWHAQSYLDSQITREFRVRRVGFETKITDSQNIKKSFFTGLNEAITKLLEQRSFDRVPANNSMRVAVEQRSDLAHEYLIDPILQRMSKEVPATVTLFFHEDQSEKVARATSSYAYDVDFLRKMAARISGQLPQEFASAGDAMEMMESAYFTGDVSVFKRAIRQALGPKGLLVLSRWDQGVYYSEVVREHFCQFLQGEQVDIDTLIADLELKNCSVCGNKSGGSICSDCKRAFPKLGLSMDNPLVCKFCGDPTTGGICESCK